MADEHDPKRHTVFRFEHAGIMSEPFLSRDECVAAAKVKVLAYPKEPAVIFTSTEVLTVDIVTVRPVYPWYPPVAATEPAAPEASCDEAIG